MSRLFNQIISTSILIMFLFQFEKAYSMMKEETDEKITKDNIKVNPIDRENLHTKKRFGRGDPLQKIRSITSPSIPSIIDHYKISFDSIKPSELYFNIN